MRQKNTKQIPLKNSTPNHKRSSEYKIIGEILDANPEIYDLAHEDLTKGVKNENAGANGMSTQQVVRAGIILRKEDYSYDELAFHLADSTTFRDFCDIGFCDESPKKSALNKNIKALSSETWEAINDCLMIYADEQGIEKGKETRTDCTVTSSNIHDPRDSEQLWDCVRVLERNLVVVRDDFPAIDFNFMDHTRRAKRRSLGVLNAKNEKERLAAYKDLLFVTKNTVGYADIAVERLRTLPPEELYAHVLADEIERVVNLANKVIDQTERRKFKNEKVPASEKIVSIFEPHTDIIIKDRRETFFGHKICLTGGKSNLILDCVILEGNPADSTLTVKMADRLDSIYFRYPNKMSFDGGFSSQSNLGELKERGVKDVCLSKGRGLAEEDMCRRKWVYKRLRKFRAGIESGISWLKRSFGLVVCIWKGFKSFKSYVWSSIVSANLTTLARLRLKPSKG